jgi:tetratricopeptide (TPR) repeat protein
LLSAGGSRISSPGIPFEALVRHADLRRRQGSFEEAAELFRQVEFHRYAQLGRALVALGEAERARRAHGELRGIATEIGSDSLCASALAVEGLVAEGEGDLDTARSCIEDAIDLLQRCGDPFETARSRLDLARVLAGLGRQDPGAEQARAAYRALADMQAERSPTCGCPHQQTWRSSVGRSYFGADASRSRCVEARRTAAE